MFYLHHCYLDLLWERWKRQHPTTAPYLPEADMQGPDRGATLIFRAPGKPAPWTQTWTVGDVLATESLDYTYGLFTGNTATECSHSG